MVAELPEQAGVQPEDTLADAGRKILQHHYARMVHHEPGARLGQDIEELHNMRVAVRRMRAAFRTFSDAFKPKAIKAWLKGLRATGRALGRVRDLDVFMEKAHHYLEALPEEARQGLDPLFSVWQQEREEARAEMLAYLDGQRYQTFKREFEGFLETPGAGVASSSENRVIPDRVRFAAPLSIYSHLAAVRAYEPIVDHASIEQLHQLRITFKRLRYTVEFFREVLGKNVEVVVKDLKQVQDHLGDLNDADVACRILSEFLEAWDRRQLSVPIAERQNSEPIAAYLAAKHAERHRLLTTFNETWAHFNRPSFRRNLALAIARL